jgi:hypothetical protein
MGPAAAHLAILLSSWWKRLSTEHAGGTRSSVRRGHKLKD